MATRKGGLKPFPKLRPMRSLPFINPKIVRQKAKGHRLVASGEAPPGDKASLRAAANAAAAVHRIKRIPNGKRTTHKPIA